MNYAQMTRFKQQLSRDILLQLNAHAREVYGAMHAAQKFIMTSPNPMVWLTAGSMRRDLVELLRLYMKPETFDRVAGVSKQHHNTWMAARQSFDTDVKEMVGHYMHMMQGATPAQKLEYIVAELMTGFLELQDVRPLPIQALIKDTIFDAIARQHFTAYQNLRNQGVSVNTTFAPIDDTCLMFAIRYKRLTALKWIMRDHPNVHRMNNRGETALTLAVRAGLDDLAQELRGKGVVE